MDIGERIERRLRPSGDEPLVRSYESLAPVAHVPDPVGRERALEGVLDLLDPAFERGGLPPNGYVWGPKGAGKSAIVSALFDRLGRLGRGQRSTIHTATRATVPDVPSFVYVDARHASSPFGVLHAVLDGVSDEPIPERGISSRELRERLAAHAAAGRDERIVVAVDHLNEPGTIPVDEFATLFAFLEGTVSWIAIGTEPPADVSGADARTVEVEPYGYHALVDVVSSRAEAGLRRGAFSHDQVREVVEWADGDAHDALTAVFGAAVVADRAGRRTITPEDLDDAIDDVPTPCVPLGRLLALSANRRRVLLELVALDDDERRTVETATNAIAGAPSVALSTTTVKRLLYELADVGVVERVRADESNGKGRPPSRVEPRFPTLAFRELASYGE